MVNKNSRYHEVHLAVKVDSEIFLDISLHYGLFYAHAMVQCPCKVYLEKVGSRGPGRLVVTEMSHSGSHKKS